MNAKLTLEVVNKNAAGIDIGSRSHWVAVGQSDKDIKKNKTAKQFTSWLRLAPNNKVSGGKVLSSKVGKGSNRLKIVFRNAANAIEI